MLVRNRILLVGLLVVGVCTGTSVAQQRVVTGPNGQPMVIQDGKPVPASQPSGKPGDAKRPDEANKSGAENQDDKGKKEQPPAPKVIRRDERTSQNETADPDEFNAMVGEDGRVAFEFRNQPWVDLVQWLADISDLPLDWLELPGDRVNLRSPGRYTVEETRDLFNRYLLARGYTLLEIDGGLTVAKTETINPAIVPRVAADDLVSLPPHTFARTSLDVGWLSADKLAEELSPMISSNGKLTALTTTNRIEAMDAAINLRQIAHLLEQERSSASLEALAPEFKLRHLPAEEAKQMLEQFLGVEKKEQAPLTPQQIQMMQQMRNQNPKGMPQQETKTEISIVANVRQNSVIIRAPADRTAIAMEFLKRIDVPSESMASLSDIQTRVQVFRLASLDPEKLVEIVSEMNVLEPTTRVRIDKDNNALIVSGSAADRYIIDSLIKRLDGSGRSFEVLPLRRLDPVEVAESISFLMGQKDEEEDQSSSRRYYYGFYGRDQEEEKPTDEFRVAANTRYRQVLLWANEQEMEEVRSLLIKLGELPPPGGSRNTVRVIDASATPETYEYLQRLRQQWNRLSPNPLELPNAEQFKEPNQPPPRDDAESEDEEDDADASEEKSSEEPESFDDGLAQAFASPRYRLAVAQNGDDIEAGLDDGRQDSPESQDVPAIRSAEDFKRAFERPPASESNRPSPTKHEAVRIEIDSSGNIVLTSPDTGALDQLENLMLQIAPPKRPYHVFHIKNASASWMRLNLEDYYADLEEDEDSGDDFYRWYFGFDNRQDDTGPSGLGKGNKLRFVDDPDTNTLVVSGATPEQLRTIGELIELWDVPEPVNKRKARFTRLVRIEYGKAEKIAETVKEAYRDLLSSNDKAFSSGGGRGGNQPGGGGNEPSKSRDGNGSSLQNAERGQDGGGTDFSFKGKLSLGIDNVGNTLLVSAEGEPLLELVTDMIKQLDEAARPQGVVEVLKLSGSISGESLQSALRPISGDAAIKPAKPNGTPPPSTPNGEGE